MKSLDNFFEESCLDLGPELNFWIEKLQKIFPWYVNAATDWPCAPRYADLVRKIENLSPEEWEEIKEEIIPQDGEISAQMVESNNIHFAIKYNPFMGVRSDYFLREEA